MRSSMKRAGRLLAMLAALWLCGEAPLPAQRGQPVAHTPWLGLRFVQDGEEARLTNRDLLTTEVRLRRRPFRLLLPRRGADDVYMVTAWTDNSIFANVPLAIDLRDTGDAAQFSYFSFGSGIADTAAGSGTLYLNDQGHNHLRGLRLGPDRDRHAVYYSALFRDRVETPIEAVEGPLYLVAFFDEDDDGVLEHGEYEFIVLTFAR